jgi:hypothetical protein
MGSFKFCYKENALNCLLGRLFYFTLADTLMLWKLNKHSSVQWYIFLFKVTSENLWNSSLLSNTDVWGCSHIQECELPAGAICVSLKFKFEFTGIQETQSMNLGKHRF